MKKYVGTKQIVAKPMTRGEYNLYRGWTIPLNENPKDEGYLVKYMDGYESWSPAEQFEKAYRECDNMTFGLAIEEMKKGKRVARNGSYNNFLDCFLKIAYDFVGSGYVWLINDSCKLEIITTQNQNTPLSNSVIPLLNLDLWEHAYYLQYKNRKNTYIDNWFKLVNWNSVNQRYISMH